MSPDARLAALARRAAADPGDLAAAIALRAEQERAGCAPPVRVLVARAGEHSVWHMLTPPLRPGVGLDIDGAPVFAWGFLGWVRFLRLACGAWLRPRECERVDVGAVTCPGCVDAVPGLTGTPADRVRLEREAAALAARVGRGAEVGWRLNDEPEGIDMAGSAG